MFKFSQKYNYNKEECYKHIANKLICTLKEEKINIFGFVSSNINRGFLNSIVKNIAEKTSKKEINTLVINACFNDESKSCCEEKFKLKCFNFIELKNISSEIFSDNLSRYKNLYDLILIAINSINNKAESIEYAKICKEIIIVEKCMECYYSSYENMLMNFKIMNIKPRGVITVY